MNWKQKMVERPVVLTAALLLVLGGGAAAVQTVVSPTATGTVSVDTGYNLSVDDVTSGSVDGPQSFTITSASGSTWNVSYTKENLANDKTEGLAEPYVLDKSGTDLDAANVERIDFDAVQTTPQSLGSSVPAGRTANFTLVWNATGHLVQDSGAGYYNITAADYDSDSEDEIVVCVGDSDGLQFGPNETWNAQQRVDTRSSFPTGDISATVEMVSLYDPSTGDHSSEAANCGQYQ